MMMMLLLLPMRNCDDDALPAAEFVAGDAHVDAAAAGAFPCYLLFFVKRKGNNSSHAEQQ